MTGPHIRCLIVEDNPDDEELVIMELRRGGLEVTHERVETEGAMRSALAAARWDLVISDYSMPHFSAPRALALLRGLGLDTPFIIVSGTVGEEAAVAAMRSGANDYVLKDNLTRLVPVIERERREAESRTERRKMREQLLISERMASVGLLAAGVAHEINNPLTSVITNLELATRELQTLAEQLNCADLTGTIFSELDDARESAQRVRTIVRDLKIFSRLPDSEQCEPVTVADVLDSSLKLAWNEIRHRAHLVKNYGHVPPVHANEARLGQVFLNLIVNAAQSIRDGSVDSNSIQIVTSFDQGRNRVWIEFRDSGCGISKQDLGRIFNAFFTTKPVGVGTGLGLAICHKIVTDFGGELEVQSEVGKGTIVRVALPASQFAERAPVPEYSTTRAPRSGRILIVDDDTVVARAIARILEKEHSVTVSHSASEALQRILSGEVFDVILCDLMMPDMTGEELHAELQRLAPEQAENMIFATGGAFTASAAAFMSRISNQYIEKPFERQHLRNVVNAKINNERTQPVDATPATPNIVGPGRRMGKT